jgi:hypothetical protein
MNTASLDPRIGKLNSGRFYAFADGYDKPETVGTLAQVERALGIEFKTMAAPAKLRAYAVTMTPRITVYAGSSVIGEHTSTIVARTAAEAISEARRQYREAEGAERVPATFTAKLAD